VKEMTSGTEMAACSIEEYSKGWANRARLSVGFWSCGLSTKVRTSASVIAALRPMEA
jgi:hypothetical protein